MLFQQWKMFHKFVLLIVNNQRINQSFKVLMMKWVRLINKYLLKTSFHQVNL